MNEFEKWFADGGDKRFRYSYELDENSLVFDLGGYEGEFAKKIFEKYGCSVFIFEPIKKYYELIKGRFEDNKKIQIFNFGFSDSEDLVKIYHSNDASSLRGQGHNYEQIYVKKISEFLSNNHIKKVDLLKINIEGSEFEVLGDIIDANILTIFDNIQVQFHSFVDDAVEKREYIRNKLKQTHEETYCYEFVWENWKKKQIKHE